MQPPGCAACTTLTPGGTPLAVGALAGLAAALAMTALLLAMRDVLGLPVRNAGP